MYKEYEVLKNGMGAMTTAKNKIFIGLYHVNCYLVKWNFSEGASTGEIFPGGENEQIFS